MTNILIVEDDKVSYTLLRNIIRREQHEVFVAVSVENAWETLEKAVAIDLVFLDNHLGREYGWELLKRVRNHLLFKHVPVVVYTASSDRSSVMRYIELGVQNILTKPYAPKAVLQEVDKALNSTWRNRFFEPADRVCRRLCIDADNYYRHLQQAADDIQGTATELKNTLGESGSTRFYNNIEALRSNAVSLGVGILDSASRDIQDAFNADDVTRTVNSLRSLDQIAQLMRMQFSEHFGLNGDGSIEAYVPESANGAEPAKAPQPQRSVELPEKVQQELHPEADFVAGAGFDKFMGHDMLLLAGTPLQQRESALEAIVSSTQQPPMRQVRESLETLKVAETLEQDTVMEHVKAVEPLSRRLRHLLPASKRLPEGEVVPLDVLVTDLGQTRVMLAQTLFLWLKLLREVENPLRLEVFAARHFLIAELAQLLASKMQLQRDVQATVFLRFLGVWLQAFRHPALFGLKLCIDQHDGPREDAAKVERNLFGASASEWASTFLQAIGYSELTQSVVAAQEEIAELPSTDARLVGAFGELALRLANIPFHLNAFMDNPSTRWFIENPTWAILKQEGIHMPVPPAELVSVLAPLVKTLRQRVVSVFLR